MRIVTAYRDLKGDDRRQKVLEYLTLRHDVCPLTPKLAKFKKAINLVLTFSNDRCIWRERSKKNSFYFRHMSDLIRSSVFQHCSQGYDVILTFEALFSPGYGERTLKPYVVYEDSTSQMAVKRWPTWVPDTARRRCYQRLESDFYRRAARILTTNDEARESLTMDYGISAEKIITVGQGTDFDTSETVKRQSKNDLILFVGYEFDRKGGKTLLEAFRQVHTCLPAVSLAIVGPDISVNEPGVKVHGQIKDKSELAKLYAASSIFVLPSIYDPMPHAAMEAMSIGIPVIVSTACGTKELIRDGVNGCIIEPGDPLNLARVMLRLLSHPAERERMGLEGAKMLRERCNWPAVSDRISTILAEVVAESNK